MLARSVDAVARVRYVLILVAGLLAARAGYAFTSHGMNDWYIFEMGARSLIHWRHMSVYAGNPLHLYVNLPMLQIGPPALLAVAGVQWLPPHVGNVVFVVLMTVMGVVAFAAAESTAAAVRPAAATTLRRTSLLLGVPFLLAWGYTCGQYHHVDDAMALTGVAVAAWVIATRRPWWVAALVLGVAVASKPWAIVCVPMLLGLAREQRGKALLVFLVSAASWWLPFFAAAPETVHALGTYRIFPRAGSVPWLFCVRGDMSHWLRPVQFDLGIVAALWAARRVSWTAAPLAGIAVRVLFDPYTWSYYGLGPLLVVALWELSSSRRRAPVWTAATFVVFFVVGPLAPSTAGGVARLVWVVAVTALALARRGVAVAPRTEIPAARDLAHTT